MNQKNYCVYLHKNKQSDEVYYIGSGVQNKREFHFCNRSKDWHAIHDTYGTTVVVYAENLSKFDARELEQRLIDSNTYPKLVNSRRVNKPTEFSEEELSNLKNYVIYDTKSVTFLSWIKKAGPRSTIGKQVGSLSYDKQGRPRSISTRIFNKSIRCSRLVWMLFNGVIPQDMVIDHIDGNPHNNNINNLRCISIRENSINRGFTSELPSGIYKKHNAICAYVVDGAARDSCSFSLELYGYELALENAKIWRINKLSEYNLLHLYTSRHLGFEPEDYINRIPQHSTTSSSGENFIWVKKNKDGLPVSVSAGLSRKPRKYFNLSKSRSYDDCITLAKQHLDSLLKRGSSSLDMDNVA